MIFIFFYFLYFVIVVIAFRILYPDIPIPSPTIQYMIALTLVGIPFLGLIILIAILHEKDEGKGNNINLIFKINKNNILFWSFIIIFNLIGFILENSK